MRTRILRAAVAMGAALSFALSAAAPGSARAQPPAGGERDAGGGDRPAAVASIEAGTFLPLAFSPQVGVEAAFAAATTSYEGAESYRRVVRSSQYPGRRRWCATASMRRTSPRSR